MVLNLGIKSISSTKKISLNSKLKVQDPNPMSNIQSLMSKVKGQESSQGSRVKTQDQD